MKSTSFLNLFDLKKIDEIYFDDFTKNNIVLPKSKLVKNFNKIDYNETSNKKILFMSNFKNFKKFKKLFLKNKANFQFCLFEVPYNYDLKKKLEKEFKYKIYYFLPDIKNPEIIITKKDLKYLVRYWSLKKNSFFKNIYFYIFFYLLKYKLALFIIPKVMIINEE